MLPLYSPTPLRDFIWAAEYTDGTYLTEFNHLTKEKNDFYSIRKQDLIRFGLAGHGFHFYYDVFGGSFHLPQGKFDFIYKYGDAELKLTENPICYNDIITYKQSISTFNPLGIQDNIPSQIIKYVFGYKEKLTFQEVNMNVKIQFVIPFGSPMFLSIELVANKEMEGTLQIIQNNAVIEELHAPLLKDVSGEFNWVVN
ncbi:hypothetical protein [Brevibacillus porteri]|uniref:hypothetical protein n=1 Tax=Brevibacillus porteri TaxID=2126350 RepID=UPI003635E4B8